MNVEINTPHVKEACYHCGENCVTEIHFDEKLFCCEGCKMVYSLLSQNGLCSYYDLNNKPGINQLIKVRENKFDYLDKEEIKLKLLQFTDGHTSQLTFYLPQMHCSSCLYLIENISKINNGIVHSEVNFAKKEVFLVYNEENTSLSKVAASLAAVGYEPYISLEDYSSNKPKGTHEKVALKKLGIAAICFASIMMISLADYFAGGTFVEKEIGIFFRYLNLFIALPAVFYSATSFYSSAWKSLKQKFINIDAPIVLAIAITFFRSIYEVVSNTGAGYFDSMTGIICFMLLGRYLQNRTQQAISFERDFKSYFPISINVINPDNTLEPTPLQNVKINDTIKIYSNEIIPADGIITKGNATIDYSFVNGESIPVLREIGELVYAGGKPVNGSIEVLVMKEVAQGYLTSLWNKEVFKKSEDSSKKSFIHKLSQYFSFLIFLMAASAGLFWLFNDSTRALNAVTSVLIVICPCTLLLSSTFTYGSVVNILNKYGMYLRDITVLEVLSKASHIVFDKTGTLTDSKYLSVDFEGQTLTEAQKILVKSVATQSHHPLSRAISYFLENTKMQTPTKVNEEPGKGVEAFFENNYVRIGSEEFVFGKNTASEKTTSVFVMIDMEFVGVYKIKNNYRNGLQHLIKKLQSKFKLSVISGDNESEKAKLSSIFENNVELRFNQSPTDKLEYIQSIQKTDTTVMIGDGLNDAGALKQSDVGIIISDNVNNFYPSCDAILLAKQFNALPNIILLAKKSKQIILISFGVSLLYNIVGVSYAVQGNLSPMVAAILMPMSSISILLVSNFLSRYWGRKLLA